MATIYSDDSDPIVGAPPKVGATYWWFSSARELLTITIIAVKDNGGVTLEWRLYKGLRLMTQPQSGTVDWNKDEWQNATLGVYKLPVSHKDLAPDEEICRSCHGLYFETERDLEILGCIRCHGAGKTKKSQETPAPTRRSELHPPVPAKQI